MTADAFLAAAQERAGHEAQEHLRIYEAALEDEEMEFATNAYLTHVAFALDAVHIACERDYGIAPQFVSWLDLDDEALFHELMWDWSRIGEIA